MAGSRRKKRRKTKSSVVGWAGRGVICTRAGGEWSADVCKALPGRTYSLLCSIASGRNEVRARGWHGQAMDKKAGRGEGGEWEDARDAAAEMAWNGAAIWHACTCRARGRERERGSMRRLKREGKREEVERTKRREWKRGKRKTVMDDGRTSRHTYLAGSTDTEQTDRQDGFPYYTHGRKRQGAAGSKRVASAFVD